MLISTNEQLTEVRHEMRGGQGDISLKALVPESVMPGKCRIFSEITIPAGCSIGYHEHIGETEVFFFTKGNAVVNDNGNYIQASAGDVLVTCNAGHGVENQSDSDVVMTAVIISE